MQFIDLVAQQRLIREKIENNILAVLDHGRYIMGPEIKTLEQKLADYVGVKHAMGCSSGTDALLLALMAHGIGPRDAVFTSPFTFIATAEVISLLGAVPVFVDVNPNTFNMDPDHLERSIKALTDKSSGYPLPRDIDLSSLKPKGIIGVDLFGLSADYDRINDIAEKYERFVIEDAAQSFGGEYKRRMACSLTKIACTSFFPAKPLGCYGDGGMCFTDDGDLIDSMRSYLVHGGGEDKYNNIRIGINGRMDTIQAAVLLAKFDIFPKEIQRRQEVAQTYSDLLSKMTPGIILPKIPPDYLSAWAQYSILAKDNDHRSSIQNQLKEAGVPTAIYYPKPLHLQTAFEGLGYREGDFPISEDFSHRIISIPMHPYLKGEDQEEIVQLIAQA